MNKTSNPPSVFPRPVKGARHRSGFTLVELLAVIGIIVVLVSLSIVGYRKLNRSGKDNATHAALQSLRAWTTELEATTAQSAGARGFDLLKLPAPPAPSVNKAYLDPTAKVVWTSVPPPNNAAFGLALDALVYAGDVNMQGINPGQARAGRYGEAVQATSIIMGRLMALPSVKAAIEQMPPERFLKDATGNAVYKYSGAWSPVVGGPVLLDGYGNPIIFVPSAGLRNVDRGGRSASGNTGIDRDTDPIVGRPYRGPVRARDDKPFWASAGSDGKFTGPTNGKELKEGDDNVYSFDQ